MKDDERTQQLLQEIRDALREQLAEYRRVAQQSLDLQQRAASRQEQATLLYKRIVAVGGVLVTVLFGLLVYLLVRWSHYLFR
jgi:type VI protein secretion system component VasF